MIGSKKYMRPGQVYRYKCVYTLYITYAYFNRIYTMASLFKMNLHCSVNGSERPTTHTYTTNA